MNQRRVIKIGGSLLDLPDLPARLRNWMDSAEPRQNILVMGGGDFCNQMRILHRRFQLTERDSHFLCLDLMQVTAKLAGTLLDLPVISDMGCIPAEGNNYVLNPSPWIQSRMDIPTSWELTADSISALVAREINADLCMLKSVDSRQSVDSYFSVACQGINRIEFVNLRKVIE